MSRRQAIALLCLLPWGAEAQMPIPAPEPAAPVPAAPTPAPAARPAPVASQAVPGPSPEKFLDDLYRPYLDKGFKGQPYAEAARFFEPVLADAMEQNRKEATAAGKKPALNDDPFVDAKDWLITKLEVAATTSKTGATGTVLIVNQGKPRHITIALVPTPAGWRIADIRGGPVSLRALYKLN